MGSKKSRPGIYKANSATLGTSSYKTYNQLREKSLQNKVQPNLSVFIISGYTSTNDNPSSWSESEKLIFDIRIK